MFQAATTFNGDISNWDVRLVTSTARMFADALSFRGDLSNWELENVVMIGGMFQGALQFSQSLCWEALDVNNVVDAMDMFCGTQGANLDPCCVNSYLVDQSCCSGDICQSVCLDLTLAGEGLDATQAEAPAQTPTDDAEDEDEAPQKNNKDKDQGQPTAENEDEDDADGSIEVGGEVDLTGGQEEAEEASDTAGNNSDGEIGNWEGFISAAQGTATPSTPIVVPERDVIPNTIPDPTQEPTVMIITTSPTEAPVTSAPSMNPSTLLPTTSPATERPTVSPTKVPVTTAEVPTPSQTNTTSAPSEGETVPQTSEPTALTDDFFLDRPDTDDNFLVDDAKEEPLVEEVGAESDYMDGENILTAIEEMEEEVHKEADPGLIAMTVTFMVIIFFMLIAFTAGTWTMQRTSFGGMPHDGEMRLE